MRKHCRGLASRQAQRGNSAEARLGYVVSRYETGRELAGGFRGRRRNEEMRGTTGAADNAVWFLKRAYVTNGDVNLARLRESRGTGARRFYKQRVRHGQAWAVPEAEARG